MKIFVQILFLSMALLPVYGFCASDLTADFPASSGYYNKVILVQPQPGTSGTNINCSLAQNAGLLFMDPNSKNLDICANGTATPFPEVCFNRYCSCKGTSCSANCSAPGVFVANICPNDYTQAATSTSGGPIIDTFKTSNNYTVYSTVCCTSNSPLLPQT